MRNDDYLVKVGKDADYRLKIMHKIFQQHTISFLKNLGLSPGMKVLEIGCGTGYVTRDLANIVGPEAEVHAIDISHEQIAIAKENTSEFSQISFHHLSVEDLGQIDQKFDFVVSRFVLMHLKNPLAAIQKMYDCVKPHGYLACEEPEMSECFSAVPSSSFNTSIKWLMEYAKKVELDFNIGKQLFAMFQKFNSSNTQETIAKPKIYPNTPEHKILYLLTKESKNKYLEKHIATAQEIDHAVFQLEKLLSNPKANFDWTIQHQVSAQKT